MKYLIWYPSGGFGHFIVSYISNYCNNFARFNKVGAFSKNGDSHLSSMYWPSYRHRQWDGHDDMFSSNKNYAVLVDNGINNEGEEFKLLFPGACTIKICYDDHSWPVIARTMIEKAWPGKSFDQELDISPNWSTDTEVAYREKYFLFLRDHEFRHRWKPNHIDSTLNIGDLIDFSQFRSTLDSIGVISDSQASHYWNQWLAANWEYILPVNKASKVMYCIKNNIDYDINDMTIWQQGVLCYYLFLEFNFELPFNDYSNWFTNVSKLRNMLISHGVNIDSN